MSKVMNITNAPAPQGTIGSEADINAYMEWSIWYTGLRGYLHEVAFVEEGDTEAMSQFLDAYGLAMEAEGGNQGIFDYLCDEPPESVGFPEGRPIPKLMSRVWAAVEGRPLDFPAEDLSAAAVAMRMRANTLIKLAESIERGEFTFPQPVASSVPGQQV
jgi:hypothetical protein